MKVTTNILHISSPFVFFSSEYCRKTSEMLEYRNNTRILILKKSLDLYGDFTTTRGDEFRKSLDSIVGVLTHVNLQS